MESARQQYDVSRNAAARTPKFPSPSRRRAVVAAAAAVPSKQRGAVAAGRHRSGPTQVDADGTKTAFSILVNHDRTQPGKLLSNSEPRFDRVEIVPFGPGVASFERMALASDESRRRRGRGRGYSVERGRGDAALGTRMVREDGSPRPQRSNAAKNEQKWSSRGHRGRCACPAANGLIVLRHPRPHRWTVRVRTSAATLRTPATRSRRYGAFVADVALGDGSDNRVVQTVTSSGHCVMKEMYSKKLCTIQSMDRGDQLALTQDQGGATYMGCPMCDREIEYKVERSSGASTRLFASKERNKANCRRAWCECLFALPTWFAGPVCFNCCCAQPNWHYELQDASNAPFCAVTDHRSGEPRISPQLR